MSVRVGGISGGIAISKKRKNAYSVAAPVKPSPTRGWRLGGNRNRALAAARFSQPRASRVSFSSVGGFFARIMTMGFAAAVIVAVSVGLLAGYRWLTTVNYFDLTNVDIAGVSRLSQDHVRALAEIAPGDNLLSLDMEQIRLALTRDPWIESATVKRVLPGSLSIQIVERVPAYLVHHQGGLYYCDESGRLIDRVEAGTFVSLPQIEVEAGMEKRLALLAELKRTVGEHRAPFRFSQVGWIRLSWGRGLEVQLMDSDILMCIGSENWMQNLHRLNLVWADLKRRGELDKVGVITAQDDKVWVEKKS
ncbi:FtsQ-type POTRA domain-containing protein [Desulfovibrio sulfodismutans]|uniref:FtsQ-type POTRA domain-containing protein n=1 Tax=Desulfolutivibrio sulfodismutans TaxID=63561 RepID=A0A7K3NJW8_9BACT|nr:FtsQ-type POTRA domain-containing protein [Desulfolutivibrio sulfodismutans]NDY56045.1 FtsQ-type POTRA domain-containing protein [Desulfolutivibrio sulfodismutans]QLA12303.1 FtsQ-type POTRA domain-containing protein [Desulfolutivibrio sulfodismutans DSM 3696]